MKYPKISEYLNRDQAKYINTIQRYESQGIIKFEENEKKFSYKNIPNQQGLIYLDDFEIIDQGLALILDIKFNKSLQLIQVKYLSENNKIFLAIDLNQTYIYEIVNMNPNGGIIIVEYLIGIINANFINSQINSLVCNFILNIGLPKLINSNQPIPIVNSNICLILYPINISPVQNINQPQLPKIHNNNINNEINPNVILLRGILTESTPPKNINILQSYNPSLSNLTVKKMNNKSKNKKVNNNNKEKNTNKESLMTVTPSKNNQEKYDSELLKHLIRFPFFKKELKLPKTIPTKDLNVGYLVKKEAIEKLKKYYDLKELIEILSKNNVLNDNIDYQNCDANYPKISEYLNRDQAKYINTIERYESQGIIRFEKKKFSYKNIPNQQGFNYLDDFEIIDQGLALILDNKFNKSLQLIQVKYLSENNKIFLAINLNQTYMYEIVSMNPNGGNIIVEYLIGIINTNVISADINSLICNFILNIGIDKLIKANQPDPIPSSNICLILYPINIPPPQKIIQPQPVNVPNNNANNGINSNTMIPKPMGANLNISTPPKNINILNSYNPTLSNSGVQNMSAQDKNIPQQPLYLIHKKFMEIMKPPVHGIPTDFKQYKIKYYQTNNGFIFPMDFDIIEKETLDKINKFLNNMVAQNIFEEIYYIPINDGFIFIPKNNHIPSQNNLIYVYKGDIKTYKPHIIIQCANTQDRDNKFNLIAIDPARKNFIQNYKYFQSKYSLYCLLININNQQKITGEQPQQIINPIYKFEAQTNNVVQINNSNKVIINPINNEKMGLNNSDFNISDRLKVMLLLAVSQIYDDYRENKLSKIYLINPEWLEQYKYKKIKSLVLEKSNEIIKLWNYSYDLNSLSQIIPILDKEKLQKYDSTINFDNQIYHPTSEQIVVKDKYIDIYRRFVIVNEQLFKLFQKYFKLPPTNEEMFYIHKKGEDLIILKNHQIYNQQNQVKNQNSILAGIIKKEENSFDIKYIFDYIDKKNIIENEMKILSQYNIPNYILNRTGLSLQNNKEMISPIFDNKNLIGNCYRYNKNYDYKNCINYSYYLSNDQLWAVIYLYVNDLSIKSKLKNPDYNDEEFYLIKKEVLNDIKKVNNYNQLKKFFEGRIYSYPSEKEVYNIIRQLPQNHLVALNNNLHQTDIPQPLPSAYQIELSSIPNPNNPNESYMILKDFELIEKQFAKTYLAEKYPYHIIKCSLVGENTIVFHYPINKFNNKNYIFVVAKIDENNNFINQYLLIYKNQNHIQSHFSNIKHNLLNYLQNQFFVNNTAPIVVNGYVEIGLIIKLFEIKDYSSNSFIVTSSDTQNLITLYFESGDQSLSCAVLCKETDIFNMVVNKLFVQKPEFKENLNYFLCGGNRINDYKSIKDNKIKDGDHILMYHEE